MNNTETEVDFPNSITFSLNVSSELPVAKINLQYGSDQFYSCSNSSSAVDQEFAPDEDVKASWTWELKKTGSIPPGTVVWWRWRITDEAGRKYVTTRQEVLFEDQRFDWQTTARGNIVIRWYEGDDAFGNKVAREVDAGLSRLQLGGPSEKQIEAFIYSSSEEVQGAVLFANAWTGGLAFTSYNIVIIAISPEDIDSEVSGLTHELAHLVVQETTFNCLGRVPPWLGEGLAMYSEGPLDRYYQDILDQATISGELISVRSLSSSFPASHAGAVLSYSQSHSLVEFLIDEYGWEKMRELLTTFKDGNTPDSALQ